MEEAKAYGYSTTRIRPNRCPLKEAGVLRDQHCLHLVARDLGIGSHDAQP